MIYLLDNKDRVGKVTLQATKSCSIYHHRNQISCGSGWCTCSITSNFNDKTHNNLTLHYDKATKNLSWNKVKLVSQERIDKDFEAIYYVYKRA